MHYLVDSIGLYINFVCQILVKVVVVVVAVVVLVVEEEVEEEDDDDDELVFHNHS